MVKIKDSKPAINKLTKKIKATAEQLKTMRIELKDLKEKAKQESVLADKPAAKKAGLKKVVGKKPKKTARVSKITK